MTPNNERDGGPAWTLCSDRLPSNNVEVETKIDDRIGGVRNVQTLKRSGNLWFFPDMSMYVYYRPTHWRLLAEDAEHASKEGK